MDDKEYCSHVSCMLLKATMRDGSSAKNSSLLYFVLSKCMNMSQENFSSKNLMSVPDSTLLKQERANRNGKKLKCLT